MTERQSQYFTTAHVWETEAQDKESYTLHGARKSNPHREASVSKFRFIFPFTHQWFLQVLLRGIVSFLLYLIRSKDKEDVQIFKFYVRARIMIIRLRHIILVVYRESDVGCAWGSYSRCLMVLPWTHCQEYCENYFIPGSLIWSAWKIISKYTMHEPQLIVARCACRE